MNTLFDDHGVRIIENFAQIQLGMDPADIEARMTAEITRVPAGIKLQKNRLQRVASDHTSAMFRKNKIPREICMLQDNLESGLRRYSYTGAQWDMAYSTADITRSTVLAPIVKAIKKNINCPQLNSYIVTWYSQPSDKITFHRDGYQKNVNKTVSSESPIVILRLGEGSRIFEIREHVPTALDIHGKLTKRTIWSGVVRSGTLIVMSANANRDLEHAVKPVSNKDSVDDRPASSIVLRNIINLISWEKVEKECRKAATGKRKRLEKKIEKMKARRVKEDLYKIVRDRETTLSS